MSDTPISRKSYLSKNVGEYPAEFEFLGRRYVKVDDLRYGTNPHQTAAYFRPVDAPTPIGDLKVLKNGKSGLSQTNLEDISYALNICKFFRQPACACMKHVNPSGVAVALPGDSVRAVYEKSRACDPRAHFGCTAGFNCEVDEATAAAIMSTFVECVVAPAYSAGALAVFNDQERFKLNRHIRVLQCGDLALLPRYVGDQTHHALTVKVLADGSLVLAEPLLTRIRGLADLKPAQGESKELGTVGSTIPASAQQLQDLLTAWYVNLNVRSNGVVIVKNGETLAVGTGEQDRVGAVEQAVWKCREKYEGSQELAGAVMASDGFFPFPDAVEVAAAAGVTAVISPAGSLKDAEVIARANELKVALFHAPERIFSHH